MVSTYFFYKELLKCKEQIRCPKHYVRRMLHYGQIQKFSISICSICSISATRHFIVRNITVSCIAILGLLGGGGRKYKGKVSISCNKTN